MDYLPRAVVQRGVTALRLRGAVAEQRGGSRRMNIRKVGRRLLGRGEIEEDNTETRYRNDFGHPHKNGVQGALVRPRLLELGEGSVRGDDKAVALIDCKARNLLKAYHRGPKLCVEDHLLVCEGGLYSSNLRGANRLLGIEDKLLFNAFAPGDEFRNKRGSESLNGLDTVELYVCRGLNSKRSQDGFPRGANLAHFGSVDRMPFEIAFKLRLSLIILELLKLANFLIRQGIQVADKRHSLGFDLEVVRITRLARPRSLSRVPRLLGLPARLGNRIHALVGIEADRGPAPESRIAVRPGAPHCKSKSPNRETPSATPYCALR